MASACRTHTYDGKLREKWSTMRPILMEKYFPQCHSFDQTLDEIEAWLEKNYFNVKRIGRARRSIKILRSNRPNNLDSRNDIHVEELLPMIWDKIRDQKDIHDLFYEQFCDITGGSCAQGRSTRLFQFLFLFDSMCESEAPTSASASAPPPTTEENPNHSAEHVEQNDEPTAIENPMSVTRDEEVDGERDAADPVLDPSNNQIEQEKSFDDVDDEKISVEETRLDQKTN